MPNEELVVKCEELSTSIYLRVYYEDGEPTGCDYYNETPGVLTYMHTVSIPQAIQDVLIEHFNSTIMQRYAEYQNDYRERLSESRAEV